MSELFELVLEPLFDRVLDMLPLGTAGEERRDAMEGLSGVFELGAWIVVGVATAIGWGLRALCRCFPDRNP